VLARGRAEAPRAVARGVEEHPLARRRGADAEARNVRAAEDVGLLELDRRRAARHDGHAEDWAGWWSTVREGADLRPVAERDRRGFDHTERSETSREVHESALRAAGFREVDVLWRKGTDAVLAALR
jgi:hypothetical protein